MLEPVTKTSNTPCCRCESENVEIGLFVTLSHHPIFLGDP
jgi:hypothetical protein